MESRFTIHIYTSEYQLFTEDADSFVDGLAKMKFLQWRYLNIVTAVIYDWIEPVLRRNYQCSM
jgi:hypothetical protein